MLNKVIISAVICAAFLGIGCTKDSPESTAVNDQITDSVTQSVLQSIDYSQATDQSTTGDKSDYPPHQDPLDQSSAKYITYHVKDWSVAASEEWLLPKSRIPYTEVSLVNPGRKMLFTLLTETIDRTPEQYLTTQVDALKSLGYKDVTVEKVKFNGVDYWLVTAPKASYNTWQWITVQNKQATVLGCGAAKDATPSYESCLDVVIGTAPAAVSPVQ